jgi:serine/threonine protein kinase
MRAPAGGDALLGTTIGSWRVARLLGSGGMGRVYVAVQPAIGARVAIKVLRDASASDSAVVERFFQEARAVNVVKHEAIVDIIDLGRLADGAPYIVMEYLHGASLGDVLRRAAKQGERVPIGTIARVAIEVLGALEAAHAKSVIHRDLKPDNIFVSPNGRATVLDFGIAKLAHTEGMAATQTGSLLGTPAYMSPEQARSQAVDARADIYSLGVILYEATTGVLPFTAGNVFDLLLQHVNDPPAPPRSRRAEISPELEVVILRALEKDPAKRFSSAAEMKAALAAATEQLPERAFAALALPTRPLGRQASDPLAATAASRDSLAKGETMPSSPGEKDAPKPGAPQQVQLSRKMLIGLVAGAAIIGVGSAAAVLLLGRKDSPPVAPAPAPVIAMAPADASPALVEPVPVVAADGAVAALDATTAVLVATTPRDAGRARVRVDAADADPSQTVYVRPVVIPKGSFDPFGAYTSIYKQAEKAAGAKVYPYSLRWGELDTTGRVLPGGDALYDFISPERSKRGDSCIVTVEVQNGSATLMFGDIEVESGPPPCKGAIQPPRCTFEELRQKAIARGLPVDSIDPVTLFHSSPTGWQFSTSKGFSEHLDDDCQ